jgi:DNA-binding CsgD family transcriptional regulator
VHHQDRDAIASPVRSPDPSGSCDGQCLWRSVVEATPGFVLLLNRDHVCSWASSNGVSFARPAEDLVGTRPENLLDPDQRPHVWRSRAAVAAGAGQTPVRLRICPAGDKPRWVEITATQVDGEADGMVTVAVHGQDVTGEVELQLALTRSEERHRGLLALLDEAVLQLDAQARIESFNAQTLQLLGCTAERLLGVPVVDALDLRNDDGRPISSSAVETMALLADGGSEPIWRSVAHGDGGRRMFGVQVWGYVGARPEHNGYVVLLQQAGTGGADRRRPGPTRQQARSAAGLTAREGDVLDGLASGGDVPTIARQLGISVHSVRGHVKSITAKLGVHSQLQAVIAAARRGMVDLSASRDL